MSVLYTAMGRFGGGKVFTAQLIDAMGSFANLRAIAALAAADGGTIVAEIPSVTYSCAVPGADTRPSPVTNNVVDAMLHEGPVKRQVKGITPREMEWTARRTAVGNFGSS